MSHGRDDEEDKERVRKSAAHHMMFDSSQAPWGVERGQGIVPQIKKQKTNPDDMPAAGMKTPTVNPITGRETSQGRTEGQFGAAEIQDI